MTRETNGLPFEDDAAQSLREAYEAKKGRDVGALVYVTHLGQALDKIDQLRASNHGLAAAMAQMQTDLTEAERQIVRLEESLLENTIDRWSEKQSD